MASTTTQHRWEAQRSFDEIGRALRDTTFCVVDLETTGGSPRAGDRITEIGAVKVRAGEVLGEFQTLVDPGTEIPAFIGVLTGITNAMVAQAPPITAALPAFLEFAAGSVLVAHNAGFDVGFLQHMAEEQQLPWPEFELVPNVKLDRHVVGRRQSRDAREHSGYLLAFGLLDGSFAHRLNARCGSSARRCLAPRGAPRPRSSCSR
jgi:DNA polymerase-3 subunit epsilon